MALSDNPLYFPMINLIGVLGMITVNALANILPINGKNTGELSDQYPNLFVPPGWVFSIWGIIYILNLSFVTWGFLNRETQQELIGKIGYWYLAISVFNVGWLLFWHYEQVWNSTLVMLLFLVSLIVIHVTIGTDAPTIVQANFGVYLGWISLATVANITAGLVSSGFSRLGLSEVVWTALILIVILGITVFMVGNQRNIYFGFVVIWAATGIFLKNSELLGVAIPAAATVLAALGTIILVYLNRI
ncbi:MAG: tryptophan-rich sensory protein [Candidatus Kariarchaeaceae archaeon]|jgi:tryptophan-rich sensory protein